MSNIGIFRRRSHNEVLLRKRLSRKPLGGGAGTNISATSDSLTLVSFNCAINAETSFTTTLDTLTLTDNNAVVSFGANVNATLDSLTLTGFNTTIAFDTGISAGVDALTLTGFNATVTQSGGAVASDLIFTVRVLSAADPTTFQVNPTLAAADFTLSIRNAAGTMISFGQLDILPTVEPAASKIIKIVMSTVEKAAALLAASPIIEIDLEDAAGAEWNQTGVTWVGNTDNVSANKTLDILEGDHTETYAKIIIKKKGTSTEVLNKDVGGSLLPATVTITTSEP
jgi:hypothetical protein